MTAEHEDTYLPFMVDTADLARILGVSKATVNRMLASGKFPIPSCRLTDRIVRFKRPDVEEFFDAPLSVLAPWLGTDKETA